MPESVYSLGNSASAQCKACCLEMYVSRVGRVSGDELVTKSFESSSLLIFRKFISWDPVGLFLGASLKSFRRSILGVLGISSSLRGCPPNKHFK